MRKLLLLAVLSSLITLLPVAADAHGCLKGAAVGGVAGHVAGHHAVAGAAIGCVVGHHRAKVKGSQSATAPQNASSKSTGTGPAR